MSLNVHIESSAVVKMVLHAAKHPESAINGVLLCEQQDASKMTMTDYVPLFHSPLTLTPMLETALYQLDSYCSQKNLRIGGYFQANEHVHDKEPTVFAKKIAEKISEKSGPTCLVMLRNDRLGLGQNDLFTMYSVSQGGGLQEIKYTIAPEVSQLMANSLKSKLYRHIHDFDDHLHDVRCDYFNTEIATQICDTKALS